MKARVGIVTETSARVLGGKYLAVCVDNWERYAVGETPQQAWERLAESVGVLEPTDQWTQDLLHPGAA
jgi:hypothetical protein